jgi:hypothetical protein
MLYIRCSRVGSVKSAAVHSPGHRSDWPGRATGAQGQQREERHCAQAVGASRLYYVAVSHSSADVIAVVMTALVAADRTGTLIIAWFLWTGLGLTTGGILLYLLYHTYGDGTASVAVLVVDCK